MTYDPSAQTRFNLDKALKLLALGPRVEAGLKSIRREVQLSLHLGESHVPAWRIQHDPSRGPLLGGLRCRAGLDADEVRSLAQLASWQLALFGLPFGGAAGGIACALDSLSAPARRALLRAYADELRELLGPGRDLLAPDFGCNPQDMAWLSAGPPGHAAVTGKPAILGGLPGEDDPAAHSLVAAVKAHQSQRSRGLADCTYVIQGFGRLGATVARLLHEAGGRVLAVSDSHGGIWDPGGLDVHAVLRTAEEFGSCTRHDGVAAIAVNALPALACDVLIPAALGGALTHDNADKIQAGLIAEAASLATSPEAHAILASRGVDVLPDLLCNAGTLIAAAREAGGGLPLSDEARLSADIAERVTVAYEQVLATASRHQTDLHTAAYTLAIGRLAEAHRLLGSI